MTNYYKLNFDLVYHYHWSLTELENMIPWEREVYYLQVAEAVKKENERKSRENAKMKTSMPSNVPRH